MREIVDAFFRERSIVNHHLASFNDFLPTEDNPNSRMQRIVDEARVSEDSTEHGMVRLDVQKTKSSIQVRVGRRRDARGYVSPSAEPTIRIGKPFVKEPVGSKPTLTPMEARLRNLTYQAPIYLDVTVVENGVERASETVHIGDLPIMVKSRQCNLSKSNIEADGQVALSDDEYRAKLVEYGEDPLDPGGTRSSAAPSASSSASRTSRRTGSSPSSTNGTARRSRARRCSASAEATGRSPSWRRRRTACSRSLSRQRAARSRS